MLEDVERRLLTLPSGQRIALLDWGGDGPLALLHHANGFCAAIWAPVAERLRAHFRVIAMDARGHGDSARPESEDDYRWPRFGEDAGAVARQLADAHGGGRVTLGLGHSFGGTALMMAAAAAPERFASLVLVDPVLPPPPTSPVSFARPPRGESLSERAGRRREVFGSREEAGTSWRDKPLFADWDPRAFALYLAEGLRDRPDGQVELKCAAAVESAIFGHAGSLDAWAVAARVVTPALLLWARRGDFPRVFFEEVVSRMADARIVDVDAGHLVPMERPELVAELALAFVRERAGAARADQRSSAERSTG